MWKAVGLEQLGWSLEPSPSAETECHSLVGMCCSFTSMLSLQWQSLPSKTQRGGTGKGHGKGEMPLAACLDTFE
jgi:hypothetical protein